MDVSCVCVSVWVGGWVNVCWSVGGGGGGGGSGGGGDGDGGGGGGGGVLEVARVSVYMRACVRGRWWRSGGIGWELTLPTSDP
jgi:hypothetical protein